MKKILYIQQYFKTPNEAGSTRSYWISQELIKRGHQVTVVCHANTELGKTQKRRVEKNIIDGIEVISIRNNYSNKMNAFQRMWSFFKFMFFSTIEVLKKKDIDLVFASSTPLTVAFPALIRKLFKKTKYVFEVRDLWPEAPIQLGFIKNKYFIKILKWFEIITYKKAEHVITLSPGMQDGVVKYVPKEKTSMIPNMAKIDKFWVRDKEELINRKFGLSNTTFKLVYFGTMGVANGIDYLIESIKKLEDRKEINIEFVFMGEGAKKESLLSLKEKLNYVELTILDRQPMESVSKIVNNCDVSICTFSNIPILKTNSPNKLFDSLSAGKPSIVNSDGWTKEIVESYDCGLYVNSENSDDFVQKAIFLKENPDIVNRMGANARKVAETKFDKAILCKQVVEVLENVNA